MVHITRWQKIIVSTLLLLGFLFTVPNFLGESIRAAIPRWLPRSTINLGLDLQGGSYLLLEVDMPGVVTERLETLRTDIRAQLRRERINFTGLDISGNSVSPTITNPAQIDQARTILRTIAQPPNTFLGIGNNEYDITESGAGTFTLRMTEAYQRQMQNQIVSQSIEVVRRRIDELGTREPTIQQQGTERILVQVPGLKNPEQLKTILSTTAKMTFRLVDSTSNIQQALQGRVPADDELLYEDGPNGPQPYLVQRRVMVSGDRLRTAHSGFDQRTGQAVVNFAFDTSGTTEFRSTATVKLGP